MNRSYVFPMMGLLFVIGLMAVAADEERVSLFDGKSLTG